MLHALHWPKQVSGHAQPQEREARPGQGCSLGRAIPALMKRPEFELCPVSVTCKPVPFQTAASVSASIKNWQQS